jgi:catechol 2,3-dioxygenase-like lactoylglutathione lyase family enzyme
MTTLSTPQPARNLAPVARATELAYLVFERPDLERAKAFLVDFGLRVEHETESSLFLRGTGDAPFIYRVDRGSRPRFAGFAFEVDGRSALIALAELSEASALEPEDGPGGGERVVLVDPSGFRVVAIHGRSRVTPLAHRDALPLNAPEAVKRINAGQRPPALPAEVVRLGHVVLEVPEYQTTCAWYTRNFGLIPSDVQVLADGSPAVTFLRLDRGTVATDHHTLALAQGVMPIYSHSAYEVVDLDAIGMGQRFLRQAGYRHAWGIGRHLLGSQVFDYWVDPFGDKHELYCDGDLCTAEHPTGIHETNRKMMSQWGQTMPASFTRPKFSLGNVVSVLTNISRSPDLSFAKVRELARLFG